MSDASSPARSDRPRVVVRGSGSIGQRHARVFSAVGADVSLWPVRPRRSAGVDDATGALLLDDETGPTALARADLAVVATDTSRHVADAVAALDAGAARVLVEKPVAPTAESARDLVSHARGADIWVAAPLRAHEAFRHLVEHTPQVGVPASAHVWSQSWLPDWRPDRDHRESYSARADEGGVLRDLVHEIDYATVLLGEPHLLGAWLEHAGPLAIEAEQAASLLWHSGGGATVTVRLDYLTRPASRGIVLRGPDGSLEWNVLKATVRHLGTSGGLTERRFPDDVDRDHVMATQARAALSLRPDSDPASRVAAGAPATLAEGVATVVLCDSARTLASAAAREVTGS